MEVTSIKSISKIVYMYEFLNLQMSFYPNFSKYHNESDVIHGRPLMKPNYGIDLYVLKL